MSEGRYKYNKRSLKFEAVRFRWRYVLAGGLFLLLTFLAFYFILFYLDRAYLETEREKKLALENQDFNTHNQVLSVELMRIKEEISALNNQEKSLYEKLHQSNREDSVGINDVLRSDDQLNDFDKVIDEITSRAKFLTAKASNNNTSFSNSWPGKEFNEYQQYPTLAPVKDFKVNMLACGFGRKINPYNKLTTDHQGIDIISQIGTEIYSTGEGIVSSISLNSEPGGLGNVVVIKHNLGFRTKYALLDKILVVEGQEVSKGMPIGTVGITGSSIAPHLHYEVYLLGKALNPAHLLVEGLSQHDIVRLTEISNQNNQALD
jgi:murein DD-endopeptidase MepM/ murein hydrolase activator NlpD